MIELNNLDFAYPKAQSKVLSQLNLALGEGTICGLFGPNASGKSTLLKVIAGLLFPQQGQSNVFDALPMERTPEFLANIYYLSEDIYVPKLSAANYISQYSPFYPKFDRTVMQTLLEDFKLTDQSLLTNLSLGQKKKFLLSFAIATKARLLLLDEPSNGLDIPSKAQFRKVLLDHFSPERTYIVSTHQAHDLEGLIDSVVFLDQSRILLQQNMDIINTRLMCEREFSQPQNALYSQPGLDGYAAVYENTSGVETQVNLELLFNFVTSKPEVAQTLLGGGAA